MRRLLLLAALAFAPVRVIAQISPGPLSRAHQTLEGATQCVKCHGAAAEAMPRLCLSCHKEIAWLTAQGRGLHAREAKTSGKSCATCHPDHAGRAFDMVEWPVGGVNRFDHRGAGWALEGKHLTTPCEKCHTSTLRTGTAATLSPRKGTAGWVGLDTPCASCHRQDDPHRNSLGAECQQCHTAAGWVPATRFDHAKSRYALTGKHTEVTCEQCHLAAGLKIVPDANGKRTPRYKPLTFTECSSCHLDPHRGQFAGKCSSCHSTKGFNVIDRRDFNHAGTRFPLAGKHSAVACESCHGRAMATPKPAFSTCAVCHRDVHNGEALINGQKTDCASCHGVKGFRPASFTVSQHQGTAFPLNGKHGTVACGACHVKSVKAGSRDSVVQLKPASGDCASCHADSHAGQLSGHRCAECHADKGWQSLQYARSNHATTRLPLDGRHATLECAACHGKVRPGLPPFPASATLGTAGVLFRIAEVPCASCHNNPHRDANGKSAVDSSQDCASCHTSSSFRPATLGIAAHARFAFRLEGAHRAVPCAACHTGIATAVARDSTASTLIASSPSLPTLSLRAVRGTTCVACHQSPHGSQFAGRADSGRCESCHDSDAFAPARRFNHDRDAAFALAGAHVAVPCASCHKPMTVAGVSQITYRPLPHRCEDCHTGTRAGVGP